MNKSTLTHICTLTVFKSHNHINLSFSSRPTQDKTVMNWVKMCDFVMQSQFWNLPLRYRYIHLRIMATQSRFIQIVTVIKPNNKRKYMQPREHALVLDIKFRNAGIDAALNFQRKARKFQPSVLFISTLLFLGRFHVTLVLMRWFF